MFCEMEGVFGEHPRDPQRKTLIFKPSFRLGEAAGTKSLEGDRGHATVDRLFQVSRGHDPPGFRRTLKPIRWLAGVTARRLVLASKRTCPGPIAQGGGGEGKATLRTLAVFIRHGGTSTRVTYSTPDEEKVRADRNAFSINSRIIRLVVPLTKLGTI